MSLNRFITPQSNTTRQSSSSGGEVISPEKMALLKHRINILELFYLRNDTRPKREKKKKADSLSHFFNDDKEASFLVCRCNVDLLLQSKNIYFSYFFKRFSYFLDKGDEVLRAFSIGCYLLQAILHE
jgi:hypothetical protein